MPEVKNGSTVLTKVRYYKGQALTAQDFLDEQKYHSEKLRLLLKRFPAGIINGLVVSKVEDGINISTGLGVTENGDLLYINDKQVVFVGEKEFLVENDFLFIPQAVLNIDSLPLYVNLSLKEFDTVKSTSFCDSKAKTNRIEERVKVTFDKLPDGTDGKENTITIAILEKDGDGYQVSLNSPVIINAVIIKENQVQFNFLEGHDHSGNANGRKIGTQSIDLSNFNLPEKNITFSGSGHDHSGETKGQKIKAHDLDISDFEIDEDKVIFSDKGHNHSGGEYGQKIKALNLDITDFELDENKVIFSDKGHNHSGGEYGSQIGVNGIENKAITSDKIALADPKGDPTKADVSGGNGIRTSHIRNGAITKDKLHPELHLTVTESDVVFNGTGGHDHSGNDKGTPIGANGIGDGEIISDKIALADPNGDPRNADRSGGKGIRTSHIRNGAVSKVKLADDLELPESYIVFTDSKDSHDHSGARKGSRIKTNSIEDDAITSNKIALSPSDGDPGNADKPDGYGIRTSHIRNGAVNAIKISTAVDTEIPDGGFKDSDKGIFAAHIQPAAITTQKIAVAPNDGKPENADSADGTGIRTSHIRNSAVTSNKISVAVESEVPDEGFNDSHKGIFTAHIQPNSITCSKLSLIEPTAPEQDQTLDTVQAKTHRWSFSCYTSPNCILQIIPISIGKITWQIDQTATEYSSTAEGDKIESYHNGTIMLKDGTDRVTIRFRVIKFGECPDPVIHDLLVHPIG